MMNINRIKRQIKGLEILQKFAMIFTSVWCGYFMMLCKGNALCITLIAADWIIGSMVSFKLINSEITKLWLEIDEIRQNVDDEG